MRKIAQSKEAFRKKLARRPYAEKLRLLEELRNRTLVIAASRPRKPNTKRKRIPKRTDTRH